MRHRITTSSRPSAPVLRVRWARAVPAMAMILCALTSCTGQSAQGRSQPSDTSANLGLTPVQPSQTSNPSADGYDNVLVTKELAAKGYSIVIPPDPTQTAGPFHAVSAMCTGSSDGHCGIVAFLEHNAVVAVVATADPDVIRFLSQNGTDVVLDMPHYLPSDPLCCPSGGAYTADYRWNGSQVVAIGQTATSVPTPIPTTSDWSNGD